MSQKELNLPPLLACIKDRYKELHDALLKDPSLDLEKLVISKGKPLFNKGDKADALYIVINGLLQVSVTQEYDQEVILSQMGPGELVGEIGLIVGGEHSADVYAVEDSEVIIISDAAFERIIDQYPDVIQKMIAIIQHRLRRSQLVANLPRLFGKLGEEMIQYIEAHVEWIYLKGADFLFREGDEGDSVYILINGRLRAVSVDEYGNEQVLNEIERGETIGEIALITGEARTASIYAIRDSELVKLSKSTFEKITTEYPQVMKSVARILISRLRKKERIPTGIGTAMNVTIVPTNSDVEISEFANRLAAALSRYGPTLHLSSPRLGSLLGLRMLDQISQNDLLSNRLAVWLDEQEGNGFSRKK